MRRPSTIGNEGGATMAANAGIEDRIWQEHGGWKSQRAANGYIKTNLEVELSVTRAMFFPITELRS